jgi:membrane-associated protein
MDWIRQIIDFALHFNNHLGYFVDQFGIWIYLLLFLIVFSESGVILTPFLPGDALLFTVGSLTVGSGKLNLFAVLVLLSIAAPLGGFVNYAIGAVFGQKLFVNPNARILNPKHLHQTHLFYEKHGAKAILLARYLPMIRTFAPFVAGMGRMSYKKFAAYNIVGGVIWVFIVVLLGHFFGGLSFVQKNFSLVILAIIVISMLPPTIEFVRAWRSSRRQKNRDNAGLEDDTPAFVPGSLTAPGSPRRDNSAPAERRRPSP